MPGYSGKPLAQKLGIRAGDRIKTFQAPHNYLRLVRPLPDGVQISARFRGGIDICHIFSTKRSALQNALLKGLNQIRQDGMIWVSWPKQASGLPTEVKENTVRELALPLGLVDVKVCAVDDVWSGLKLVIRRENRR